MTVQAESYCSTVGVFNTPFCSGLFALTGKEVWKVEESIIEELRQNDTSHDTKSLTMSRVFQLHPDFSY